MKKFRLTVIAIFVLTFFSCMGLNREGNYFDFSSTSNSKFGITSFFGDDTKTHEFKDAKTGLTVFSIDYPASWKVVSKPTYISDKNIPFFQYQIEGPNGLKAFNGPSKNYISYSNHQVEQLSRINGTTNIRPLLSMQQLILQDVEPRMRHQGFSYIETRPIPVLERFFNEKVAENALAPAQSELFATVWSNDQEQKALVIVRRINYRQSMSQYGTYNVWFYTVDQLIANADSFEDLFEDTIKAQLTFREYPQWKNYSNQIIAQRTQIAQRQSTIAHQNRMAQQLASSKAHQERMRILNATQDASHTAFMNRTFGSGSTTPSYSEGGQQDFLNMINEEETVYNPGDGQNYQIQSGAKETWMDSDGNYIKSNNLFYNPNADGDINQGIWSKIWEDY